mgnify:CR=1 FL=1
MDSGFVPTNPMLVTSKDIPSVTSKDIPSDFLASWIKWNTQAVFCVFHLDTVVAGCFTLLSPNFAVSLTAVENLTIWHPSILLSKRQAVAVIFLFLLAISSVSCTQKKLFRKFPAFSALLSVAF